MVADPSFSLNFLPNLPLIVPQLKSSNSKHSLIRTKQSKKQCIFIYIYIYIYVCVCVCILHIVYVCFVGNVAVFVSIASMW